MHNNCSSGTRAQCSPRMLFILALGLLGLFGVGCSTMQAVEDRVDVSLTHTPKIYRDQWVNRNPPDVHVQPKERAAFAPTVLFMPFRVTQEMERPGMAGHGISRTVYQTWNTMQLFPAMEYFADDTPYRRDRALQIARGRGADVVVGGFITYLYAGGTAGDSQVALQIEAHDVASGQLIWSLAQSGSMPASKTNDFILFATKTRLPSDPIYAITQVLAGDMGKIIQTWMAGPAPQTGIQKVDQRVKDTLFPQRDPVPQPRPAQGSSESSSF
ncbi:hypothetical protein [Desulfovibrio cuneatus]|uniref:hypothetical protein n=1 Tax=Desulfovibrio cuneatus TaxID=159728 RepID=UPI0012EC2876|nr:hypothetical protein [Desulfovibrio cuneatus]